MIWISSAKIERLEAEQQIKTTTMERKIGRRQSKQNVWKNRAQCIVKYQSMKHQGGSKKQCLTEWSQEQEKESRILRLAIFFLQFCCLLPPFYIFSAYNSISTTLS